MNNDVSAASVLAEGCTTLPAPRAFGETNTLTVPRSRRRRLADDPVERFSNAIGVSDAAGHVHLAVVPADSTPITLTL